MVLKLELSIRSPVIWSFKGTQSMNEDAFNSFTIFVMKELQKMLAACSLLLQYKHC